MVTMVNTIFCDMTAFLDKDLNCLTLYLQGKSPNFFLKNSRQFKGVTSMVEVIIDRQISSPIVLIVKNVQETVVCWQVWN